MATSRRSLNFFCRMPGFVVRSAYCPLCQPPNSDRHHTCVDLLCFDWEFRTLAGLEKVVSYLSEPARGKNATAKATRFSHNSLSDVKLQTNSGLGPPSTFPIPGTTPEALGVMACFTFSLANPERTGRGFVRLAKNLASGTWEAVTVFFTVDDLVGHEEDTKERPEGVWDNHAKTWEEVRTERIKSVEEDPTVLIGTS